MKTIRIAIALSLIFAIFSCENNEKQNFKPENNVLLFKDVQVKTLVEFSGKSFLGSKNNYCFNSFLNTVVSDAIEKKYPVYKPDNETSNDIIESDEIKLNFSNKPEELNAIYFDEEWFFDVENLYFEKTVNNWSPVRVFKTTNDTLDNNKLYRRIFSVGNQKSDEKDFQLIASNVRYHITLDEEFSGQFGGLSVYNLFMKIDSLKKNHKLIAYKPQLDYNDKKDTIPLSQIESIPIGDLIFDEDWYFNPQNGMLKKIVKGIYCIKTEWGKKPDIKNPTLYLKFNENIKIENSENDLLIENTLLDYYIFLKKSEIPEWSQNFDFDFFLKNIIKQLYQGTITAKLPRGGNKMHSLSKDELIERIQEGCKSIDSINYENIKSLRFVEEWYFDKTNYKFRKKIVYYSPIIEFYLPQDTAKQNVYYKILFSIENNDSDIYIPLIKDIRYKFQNQPKFKHGFWEGYDNERIVSFLFENLQSGKLKAYEPTYLVDLKKIKLSKQQIKEILAQNIKPKEITNFIFNEDWEIGQQTYSIRKTVKGIAPVREYYDENGKQTKILFYIEF